MSLEKIKQKILDEAKEASEKTKSVYQEKVDEIVSDNKKEMETISQKKDDEINAEIVLFKKNAIARQKLSLQSKYLVRREEIFNSLLTDALKSVDANLVKEYMKTVLDENKDLSGKVTVTCSKEYIEFVNSNTKFSNFEVIESKDDSFTIASDSGLRINGSLNALVERKKSELRQGAIKALGV